MTPSKVALYWAEDNRNKFDWNLKIF